MRFGFMTCLIILLLPGAALARPITWPGGWSAMVMNDDEMNALHLLYSPSARYSIGVQHEYRRETKASLDSVGLNFLLKRWNNPGSQANLYASMGAGLAYDDDQTEPAAFAGLAADWENRRVLVAYENRFLTAGDIDRAAGHKARIGIAPYIANAGALHTWLILQADYDAGNGREFTTTPLVRMFKGPVLGEAGYNLQNETALFNMMIQF
jgi:hypothetical protein